MKLNNEFQPIRDWAQEKGILDSGDVKTQTLKLLEEAGELAKALLNNDEFETVDAIGDCCVVLTNLAALAAKKFNNDITIEQCINTAYSVIKNRKGQMKDGSFVKEQ